MRPVLVFVACVIGSCGLPNRSAIAQTQTQTDPAPRRPATQHQPHWLRDGRFQWKVGKPLVSVENTVLPDSPEHPWVSVKDPSIVRYEGRWHLFCTLHKKKQGTGRIRIGYLSFEDWTDIAGQKWQLIELTPEYHAAPQVFYFEPQKKWYMIYQAVDESRGLHYGPCYSTNTRIDDPNNWSLPKALYQVKKGTNAGLDFWVICSDETAYLFFTSLNGKMWRAETRLDDFPDKGWTAPEVALQGDVFEASHTYALHGLDKFLTMIEAQNGDRRYFKAYVADRLDGKWTPLADSREKPFVSVRNVVNQPDSWTTSYSHGEFLRSGYDQSLEIDPKNVRLLFQGASDPEYQVGDYAAIHWRLGILEPAK